MGEIPQFLLKFKGSTREKVRAALVRVVESAEVQHASGKQLKTTTLRESTKLISVTKVRSAGGGDQNAITECLREWRAGRLSLGESWGDEQERPSGGPQDAQAGSELGERLRAAKTDAERRDVIHEAMAMAADGRITDKLLQALTSALNAARLSDQAARSVEPEELDQLLPATAEAVGLVQAYEGITSDVRRNLVAEFVAEQLAKDMAEGPQANRQEGAQ